MIFMGTSLIAVHVYGCLNPEYVRQGLAVFGMASNCLQTAEITTANSIDLI
jgi:hypothetical protein